MEFIENKPYTLVSVSDMIAMSYKRELICAGHQGKAPFFKEKGKRKLFFQSIDNGVLVFEGHNVVKMDTDGFGMMHGNACFNFVSEGDPEIFKKFLKEKNLNEAFNEWGNIVLWTPAQLQGRVSENEAPIALFEEVASERIKSMSK